MIPVPARSHETEILDGELPPPKVLRASFEDVRFVNRHIGGSRNIIQAVSTLLEGRAGGGPASVLDLATGLGDVPLDLARWGVRRGLELQIRGIDLRPEIVEMARSYARGQAHLGFEVGDALSLADADESHDIVTTSLSLHHFEPEAAVLLLREMWRLCRVGFVVNDLRRCWPGYLGARFLAAFVFRTRVAKNDGPLSVLRAYTVDEAHDLARQAGIPEASLDVRPAPGFRLLMAGRK